MMTKIKVPANSIPKAWKLNIPRQQEMITLTVNLDNEVPMGKTDPEIDAQIANGECSPIFSNAKDAIQWLHQ